MMNRVVLVGRLTKDPELKYTPNGIPVANFTLAINRQFTSQGGEREADFINCVVWRKPAENVANFLKKGSLAGVDGKIQTRRYEDTNTGKMVYVTEVVADSVQFLEPKSSGGGGGNNGSSYQGNNQGYQGNNNQGGGWRNNDGDPFSGNGQIDISDDDLPF